MLATDRVSNFIILFEILFEIFIERFDEGKQRENCTHLYNNLMMCVKIPIRNRPKPSDCKRRPMPNNGMYIGWVMVMTRLGLE